MIGTGRDRLETQLEEQRRKASILESLFDQAKEHSRRQGWIATAVVLLYVTVVLIAAAAYLRAAWVGDAGQAFATAAGQIRDMANTLVLPIVTLVLGYYFGRRTE